jgi:MOSC domain-containing protein YiiM
MRYAYVQSIQIGTPKEYASADAAETDELPWTTGLYKTRVEGKIFAGKTNLAGDGQADLKHHGGIDKAVLAYSADHYPAWRKTLGIPDFPHGAFGENLSIAGLNEELIHIGDIFSIGPVVFEVSQPRQPCWKLARRWGRNDLVAMVIASGRTGWYLRVVKEGFIEPGMRIHLLNRPNPDWTIARANRIRHHQKNNFQKTLDLAGVPRLSASWVRDLTDRADRLRAQIEEPQAQAL